MTQTFEIYTDRTFFGLIFLKSGNLHFLREHVFSFRSLKVLQGQSILIMRSSPAVFTLYIPPLHWTSGRRGPSAAPASGTRSRDSTSWPPPGTGSPWTWISTPPGSQQPRCKVQNYILSEMSSCSSSSSSLPEICEKKDW